MGVSILICFSTMSGPTSMSKTNFMIVLAFCKAKNVLNAITSFAFNRGLLMNNKIAIIIDCTYAS